MVHRKLLVFGCLALVAGGCAKKALVKDGGPVLPGAGPAGGALSQPAVVERVQPGQAVKPSAMQDAEKSGERGELVPIPNAAELKDGLRQIYFEFDDQTLSPAARSILRRNSELMKRDHALKVRVDGHCDERGSGEYNLALGERRARAAMQYLVTLGVPGENLSMISFGEEKPAVSGHDEISWAKNRRDEFVVLD